MGQYGQPPLATAGLLVKKFLRVIARERWLYDGGALFGQYLILSILSFTQ